MSRLATLGLGVLARLLSTLAAQYAGWLFRHLADPDEEFDFWSDLRCFGDWLLQVIPDWFIGRRQGSYDRDGAGWEPDGYH